MESISQIIRGQQSDESTALQRASEQQQNVESLRQLGLMLEQMAAGFPHQEFGEETTEVYQLGYEDLGRQYGVTSLETALRSFLTRQKFFPHPSEVREVLDEMATKAKQKATAALPKLGCPKCHDGGFADGYILRIVGGLRQVTECDCLLERRRAKKAVEA